MMLLDAVLVGAVVVACVIFLITRWKRGGCHTGACGGCPSAAVCGRAKSKNVRLLARGVMRGQEKSRILRPNQIS